MFDESDNLSRSSSEFEKSVEDEALFIQLIHDYPINGMWKAVHKQEIVGLCTFMAGGTNRMAHRGSVAISVKKAYWRNHIGHALLKTAIAHAKANNLRCIDLEVVENNLAGIRLYESFHFEKFGYHKQFFHIDGKDIGGYYLSLDLTI